MEEKIFQEILKQVHETPLFHRYIETIVSQNTNCYSHALGATYPNLQSYRIGAICGRKPLDQVYFSIDEIKELLFLDCEKLQLKIEEIEESSLEEELLPNQYKIQLYVKIWGNGQIGDYHFLRCDDNVIWTEKWRGRNMNEVPDLKTGKMQYYPWNFAGIYKITR